MNVRRRNWFKSIKMAKSLKHFRVEHIKMNPDKSVSIRVLLPRYIVDKINIECSVD